MYKYYKELEEPNNFKSLLNKSYEGNKEDLFNYIWPNSWYITPNGYLYNSGGEESHKEGNLVYPYDKVKKAINNEIDIIYDFIGNPIENTLNNIPYTIPTGPSLEDIKQILNRGYITYGELIFYTNKIGYFPDGITKDDMMEDISNQESLIKIVVGHMAAASSFYSAFTKLNATQNPIESLKTLKEVTANDLDDILVRFCGFHKISYQDKKTITTTSYEIESIFREYLNQGWNVELVPKIYYDKHDKEIKETNLDSGFITRYLDDKLEEYKGKGKIIVRSDTFFQNRR